MRAHQFLLIVYFTFLSKFLFGQLNTEEYYKHIHLAEEQLMDGNYEDAFYNYQEAFERKKGFVQDLFNASCAMLNSSPDINLLCEWNSQFYAQTGKKLTSLLRSRDRFSGTDYMTKLTPDNWLDLEICIADPRTDLRESFFEMLMEDSVFKRHWRYEDGALVAKENSGQVHNNTYALYDILPLNRFIISNRFSQTKLGEYGMQTIENLIKNNLNLNISPLLRGMKYKVQNGHIDNRYFSLLCDHLANESYKVRMELLLEDQQFYFTHHPTFDDLEAYFGLNKEQLEAVNYRRREIYLFDYDGLIERIKFYRKNVLFFPYYKSLTLHRLSERKNREIQLKIENKELLVFD